MSNHSDGRKGTKEKQYSERTSKIALKIYASFLWVQESHKTKAFKLFQVRKTYAKYQLETDQMELPLLERCVFFLSLLFLTSSKYLEVTTTSFANKEVICNQPHSAILQYLELLLVHVPTSFLANLLELASLGISNILHCSFLFSSMLFFYLKYQAITYSSYRNIKKHVS